MQDKENQVTEELTLEGIIKSFLKPFIIGCIFLSAKFITDSATATSGGAILITVSFLYLFYSLFKLFSQKEKDKDASNKL